MNRLVDTPEVQRLLDRIAGLGEAGNGDDRSKRIVRRIVGDLFATFEDFDVSPEEFWSGVSFLQGAAPEFGLIAPGLGFDHFLDLRMDAADQAAGTVGGTPRTIEGPLYVAGAPLSKQFARLDDGADAGEVLIMRGRVLDELGNPVVRAIIDVWHANTRGAYSTFDPQQTPYNNRRRIETGPDGAYAFQSIVPSGYAVPPGGSTERLLTAVGRHGRRPAHIHFFVSAGGRRSLTTQINIAGDPDLHDDFAQATRDGLIPDIARRDDAEAIRAEGLNTPFSEVTFDFVLLPAEDPGAEGMHPRARASAS